MLHLKRRVVMSITDPIFQKANFYPEKYGRETFLADAGQRSRAIIPGDDPGDQQPPERRGLYPDPDAVRLTLARSASTNRYYP
jgi:hypothetical protein